jgi:hypothetical protein
MTLQTKSKIQAPKCLYKWTTLTTTQELFVHDIPNKNIVKAIPRCPVIAQTTPAR